MTQIKDLTVIIPYKDRENIKYCLSSIEKSNPRPNCLLVDFGSSIPVHFPQYKEWLTVIRVNRNTEHFHKARAINIGIRNVKTKFLLTTDADQIFKCNFFGVVRFFLKRVKKAFVMCKTYDLRKFPQEIAPENIMVNFDYLKEVAKKQRQKAKGNMSDSGLYGDGCCHAMETKYALSVGGYEEEYLYALVDGDMTFRARYNGRKIVYINSHTDMIHCPHTSRYAYNSKEIKISKELYWKRRKANVKLANRHSSWGVL